MLERVCPACGERMEELEGSFVLLSGDDVPAFGSRAEIMVTPRKGLRLRVRRCVNPACLQVELFGC